MPLTPDTSYPVRDAPYAQFASRRSVVLSTGGMVACTQPLAAEAGQKVLQMGGNAADAAVAVAAAMNMTEPSMTGIGGDMFCLFFDAKAKKVHSLNGSGRAAKNTTLESVRKDLGLNKGQRGSIPPLSALAATVPGAAAGWVDTVEKFGSGKLTLEQILMPAIELGEKGFPVSEQSAYYWARSESLIRNASPNFREMLRPDPKAEQYARAPRAGEIFRNPTLANTFRTLAAEGKPGFYTGRIAQAVADVVKSCGGYLSTEDLKSHIDSPIGGSQETVPISLNFTGQGVSSKSSYKSVQLWEHPPNGQGLVALMALGIMQELEKSHKILPRFSREDHNSVPYLHAVIESLRIAFSDGQWWICDPDASSAPKFAYTDLISPEYLAERAKLFNSESVCNPRHSDPGNFGPSPAQNSSDTVYFAVTDREGNGISFINSNYAGFGTCIIPAGCGFTLQNRGSNFTLQPENHPNAYAPGKRPYHTIIPALLTTETTQDNAVNGPQVNGDVSSRELLAVYGVMGGFMQPQGHLQVLMNMEVFAMNPQEALDAPRICVGPGMPDEDATQQDAAKSQSSSTVYAEDGIDPEVVEGLRKLGHDVQILRGWERGMFGRGQVIRQHFDEVDKGPQTNGSGRKTERIRVWAAGSDLRGDGCAIPAHL